MYHNLSDGARALLPVCDVRVWPLLLRQPQEIAVVRDQNAPLPQGVGKVGAVRGRAKTGLGRRRNVDPAAPECRCHRRRDVLVQQKPDLIPLGDA
jgi:hypothetical protein